MKIRKTKSLILLSGLFFISCQVINYGDSTIKRKVALNSIKKSIKLSNLEFKQLKKKDTIIAELYLALKDSVNKNDLKKHLDSFNINNYNKTKLKVAIQMERYIKKSGGQFRLSDTVNPNKAYHVKSMKEFDSIVKLMRKKIQKAKVKVIIDKKDSLKHDI